MSPGAPTTRYTFAIPALQQRTHLARGYLTLLVHIVRPDDTESLLQRGEEQFELLPVFGGWRALAFGWSGHASILQLDRRAWEDTR